VPGSVSVLAVPGRPAPLLAGQVPGWYDPDAVEAALDALVADGVRRLVCLVPAEDLDAVWRLPGYLPAARTRFGRAFLHVPVPDGAAPAEGGPFEEAVTEVDRGLLAGEPAFVHCIAGCGRTGTFCACVLVRAGLPPAEAVRLFRATRGCGPETTRQEAFVAGYARRLAGRPGR
jgi:protein-tyrosine phosphatase